MMYGLFVVSNGKWIQYGKRKFKSFRTAHDYGKKHIGKRYRWNPLYVPPKKVR